MMLANHDVSKPCAIASDQNEDARSRFNQTAMDDKEVANAWTVSLTESPVKWVMKTF